MADRKATNRYYPPEFWDDPKFSDKSNLNSFRGEGWRNRGAQVNSKLLTQGRNVIRFETPFDIWCEGCNQVIHKGVRFNADKEKVRLRALSPTPCLPACPSPPLRRGRRHGASSRSRIRPGSGPRPSGRALVLA